MDKTEIGQIKEVIFWGEKLMLLCIGETRDDYIFLCGKHPLNTDTKNSTLFFNTGYVKRQKRTVTL